MHRLTMACTIGLAAWLLPSLAASPLPSPSPRSAADQPLPVRPPPKPQPRPHGVRVIVDPERVQMDDGDTAAIRWSAGDLETVRILGIDTPETRHVEHDLPHAQPFGEQARAFAQGAFAAADRVELLRASTLDPFGRSLGYVFLNGRNYSVLAVRARLAEESISRYGDNGFPREAARVMAASQRAGPLPFEPPEVFRNRMRTLAQWMKSRGIYPEQ